MLQHEQCVHAIYVVIAVRIRSSIEYGEGRVAGTLVADAPQPGDVLEDEEGVQGIDITVAIHVAHGVAGVHKQDLNVQSKHGVSYLKYWFNEGAGLVHCLVEAPSEDAARAVHQEAHGLVADHIVEVQEGS